MFVPFTRKNYRMDLGVSLQRYSLYIKITDNQNFIKRF